MRRAMGIAVFSGMLGVTVFGIFLTPVFYVLLRARRERRLAAETTTTTTSAPAASSVVLGADGSAVLRTAVAGSGSGGDA